MDKLFTELLTHLKEKVTSPFYRSFIFSWLIWNWKIWYVTLFIDSKIFLLKTNILKIDYIGNLLNWRTSLFWPGISSLFILFLFPHMNSFCFNIFLKHRNKDKLIKDKRDSELKIARSKLRQLNLEQTLDELKIEDEVIIRKKEIEKEKTQEEKWDDDFKKLPKDLVGSITKLAEVIYRNSGHNYDGNREILSSDEMAYFHSLSLFSYINNSNQIDITYKGKYFIKKYYEQFSTIPVIDLG